MLASRDGIENQEMMVEAAMRLMLLRHAKSKRPAGVEDHDRPLSRRGRQASEQMGKYMAETGLVPDQAVVSTARRTQETWQLARPAFEHEIACHWEGRLYDASPATILEIIRQTGEDIKSQALVGHNPGLQDLALSLIGKGDPDALARLRRKLPTAGLVVIDFKAGSWGELAERTGDLERFVAPSTIAP
ncbi:SixA phosphatase family protein [Arvimicrobium flavum]|uniref:SixA phosphatase family protein n=1 Tax=Arvimicrobium flavum TaxID=3393320 RepID=UPI00237C0DDA|nr:histidine phosphatase family protein [Mesorhizobium shangrilense]